MQLTPKRISLVAQTRDVLQQGMESGRWRQMLPGERMLASELGVSRSTLRMAIAAMARDGKIRVRHGQPSEILKRPPASASEEAWQIGCVLPEPLWKIRPFLAFMIDALRMRVQEIGGRLIVHHGTRYFGGNCGKALSALASQFPHQCWLLVLSTHAMQSWFHRKRIPVIVSGSSFKDALLPSVDFDYVAAGRHAGGLFVARGHRKIMMLSSHKGRAGIMHTERGLRESLKGHIDAELLVEYHDGTPSEACRKLERVWARKNRPTALYLPQSNTYLSAIGWLAQRGVLAPRDVSLIVGQDEPHFAHMVPEPARYAMQPETFARQLASLVRRAHEGILAPDATVRLMPHFLPGATLGRVRQS